MMEVLAAFQGAVHVCLKVVHSASDVVHIISFD